MTTDLELPQPASVDLRPTGGRSLRQVLSVRDFRLLLGGTATSLLGDQFALIATPWLVLQLTHDPLALGVVLALEGLPRAAFMLVGGAVADRIPPRRVMLAADVVRGAMVAAMAAVVLAGVVELWMLFGFALGFGLISGIAVPAEHSIVPTILRRDDLHAGNSLVMGLAQLAAFVGPSVAGAVIASHSDALAGVGLAYAIDAGTFAVSAAAFALMGPATRTPGATDAGRLVESIRDGVRRIRDDAPMRFVFAVLASVNLLAVGPLLVGIPLLAHDRLSASAAAFGVLMGAFALGNLVGLVVAGVMPRPTGTTMGVIVVVVLGGFGAVIASLGLVAHLVVDAVLLAALGTGNGYLAVSFFTWVQVRTPEHFLGRTVSLVSFANLGLVSVSQAASGAIARWNLDALFVFSGSLVVATTAWAATRPGLRAFTDSLAATRPAHEQETTP